MELKSVPKQTIVVLNMSDSKFMNLFSDKKSVSPARDSRGLSMLSALLLLPLGG